MKLAPSTCAMVYTVHIHTYTYTVFNQLGGGGVACSSFIVDDAKGHVDASIAEVFEAPHGENLHIYYCSLVLLH